MASVLMRSLTPEGGMRRRSRDGRAMSAVAAEFIKPNDRLTSFERLEIYNRQYWYRLLDCFSDDFPGLRAILGDERFDALSIAYLEAHPSSSFSLRNLGRTLPVFLKRHPLWTKPNTPLAIDMARFEWAQVEAFDLEARAPITAERLRGANPAKLRVGLQPYVQLLELDHPVDEFLLAVKKSATLRGDASNAIEFRKKRKKTRTLKLPAPKKIFLAVHRMDLDLYYKRLEPFAYRILRALRAGRPVSQASAAGVNLRERPLEQWPGLIQSSFELWTELGWLTEWIVNPEPENDR